LLQQPSEVEIKRIESNAFHSDISRYSKKQREGFLTKSERSLNMSRDSFSREENNLDAEDDSGTLLLYQT